MTTDDTKSNIIAYRKLDNPPARLPLARHLTHTVSHSEPQRLVGILRRALRACGDSLEKIDHIAIAFPHKHPRERLHVNAANGHALRLKDEMELAGRGTKFPLATSLFETVRLGRSEDQSVLHALTGKQIYDVDPALQEQPLPFITANRPARSYFIIVDWIAAQATTAANLASFITHNGGTVLAVATGNPDRRLAQSDDVEMGNEHLPMNLRAGMIPALAHAFNRATGCKIPPGTCVETVEAALQPHGRSLRTLTVPEAEALLQATNNGTLPFDALIDGLRRRLPQGTPPPPKPLNWPYTLYP
jgi:hypothetical protein